MHDVIVGLRAVSVGTWDANVHAVVVVFGVFDWWMLLKHDLQALLTRDLFLLIELPPLVRVNRLLISRWQLWKIELCVSLLRRFSFDSLLALAHELRYFLVEVVVRVLEVVFVANRLRFQLREDSVHPFVKRYLLVFHVAFINDELPQTWIQIGP